MPDLAQTLAAARKAAGLSVEWMAALVDCTPDQWLSYEADALAVSTGVLDRCARVLGLRVRDLLAGEAQQCPAALLLRSMSEPSLEDYFDLAAHRTLGEFLRCVRDVAELEERMGERPAWPWLDALPAMPVEAGSEAPHGAQELARSVRSFLGLDLEPIPSLISLVRDRFGIASFFIEPDTLDRDIDGASTLNPRPAILANLIAGGTQWWRTRMTLAHELCHLLFDRHALDRGSANFFFFSPHERSQGRRRSQDRWELRDRAGDFHAMERRANAFAAYLLAPPEGVKILVADLPPVSEEAIRRICTGYQIGPVTAINLLTNIYHLSFQERSEMIDRGRRNYLPEHHPDSCLPGAGLRDEGFVDRVMCAFAAERIDAVEARQFLGLRLSDPLPLRPTIMPSRCQPLRTQADNARAHALWQEGSSS